MKPKTQSLMCLKYQKTSKNGTVVGLFCHYHSLSQKREFSREKHRMRKIRDNLLIIQAIYWQHRKRNHGTIHPVMHFVPTAFFGIYPSFRLLSGSIILFRLPNQIPLCLLFCDFFHLRFRFRFFLLSSFSSHSFLEAKSLRGKHLLHGRIPRSNFGERGKTFFIQGAGDKLFHFGLLYFLNVR